MTPFVDRMIRAAKLDVNLYEEVEADKNAMSQAVGVVALSSLAGGIGFMQAAGLTGLVIGHGRILARLVCVGFFDLHHWYKTFARTSNPS